MKHIIRLFGVPIITITREEAAIPHVEEASEPQHLVRVADTEQNRTNAFWKERIGRIGVVRAERGGMWDVHFAEEEFPCKDIDPQRFTELLS